MSNEEQKKPDAIPSEVKIHFIKGTGFRVAHANGVWFGADTQGNIHLTFYSERTPIPQAITVKLNENGQFIGEDESKKESKDGLVREMEIDIVMSVPAATAFYEMLGGNLKNASETLEEMKKVLTP